jgi:hypothetical protein
MSKIEEMTVEQTDEVVGGTSESNTKRIDRNAQSMDIDKNKTQYHVPDYSSKRLEI